LFLHRHPYLKTDGIVLAKTSGKMTWDAVKRLSEEVFAAGRKHGAHSFLVDHRDSELELSIFEIDDLPVMFKDTGVGVEDKITVLFNPSSPKSGLFLFFQNVSFLGSLQFKMFPDKDKAVAWLKSGK
jgi:hypothetical protein